MKKTMRIRQMDIGKLSLLSFAFIIFTFNAYGQEQIPANVAAPPIRALTKDDKTRLDAEKDIKKRLNLALEMMEFRIKNAETLNSEENYAEMFTQLGFFHAIIENTLVFLERNNYGTGKILNQYKRFEMNLRSFIGRLEVIRRELPPRYEYYVRTLVREVRDARTRAVEPLFGDTVMPNQS